MNYLTSFKRNNKSENINVWGNYTLEDMSFQNNVFGYHYNEKIKKDKEKTNPLSKKLFIKEKSKVIIKQNNKIIFNEYLYPGTYIFKNYPTQDGFNQYTFSIHNNQKEQIITQETFIQNTTIKKGQIFKKASYGIDYNKNHSGIK